MPPRSKRYAAFRSISDMPLETWIDIRAIAKNARLTSRAMSRYLLEAKQNGFAENKTARSRTGNRNLWRRIAIIPETAATKMK